LLSITEGSYVRAQPRRTALQKPGTGLAPTVEPWHGTQATLSSLSPRAAAGRRTSVASTATAASCRRSTAPAVSSSSGACRAASARQARTRSRPLSSRSPWRGAWGGAELGASRSTPRCGTGLGASGSTATGSASRTRGIVLNSSWFGVCCIWFLEDEVEVRARPPAARTHRTVKKKWRCVFTCSHKAVPVVRHPAI